MHCRHRASSTAVALLAFLNFSVARPVIVNSSAVYHSVNAASLNVTSPPPFTTSLLFPPKVPRDQRTYVNATEQNSSNARVQPGYPLTAATKFDVAVEAVDGSPGSDNQRHNPNPSITVPAGSSLSPIVSSHDSGQIFASGQRPEEIQHQYTAVAGQSASLHGITDDKPVKKETTGAWNALTNAIFSVYQSVNKCPLLQKPSVTVTFLLLWICFLFYLGSQVSGRYFTPAMLQLASVLSIPDALAGCTILALANGSGDLLSGVLCAVHNPDDLQFFVGSMLGASFFVTTVVFGSALWASRNSKVRLDPVSTPRDLIFCILGLCIFVAFSYVTFIPTWAPCILLPFYALYVYIAVKQTPSTVALLEKVVNCVDDDCASERLLDPDIGSVPYSRHSATDPPLVVVTEASQLLDSPSDPSVTSSAPVPLPVSRSVFSKPSVDTDGLLQIPEHPTMSRSSVSSLPLCLPASSITTMSRDSVVSRGTQWLSSISASGPDRPPTSILLLTTPGQRLLAQVSTELSRTERLSVVEHMLTRPVDALESFYDGSLTRRSTTVRLEPSRKQPFWASCITVIMCPILVIWKLTIPRLGSTVSPIWDYILPYTIFTFLYLNHAPIYSFTHYLLVLLLASVIALSCFLRNHRSCFGLKPAPSKKYQGVSDSASEIGSNHCSRLARTLITAFMALYWNVLIVTEVLRCLITVGHRIGLSQTILGLTVLAWGNSITDFFANVSVSRSGHTTMALSGAYGSSILLLLCTSAIVSITATLREWMAKNPANAPLVLSLNATAMKSLICQTIVLASWAIYIAVSRLRVHRASGVSLIICFVASLSFILVTLTQ